MRIQDVVRHLFERFQNLNLLFLIQDLSKGQVTWGNWLSDQMLCPLAHGLSGGAAVESLQHSSQVFNLDFACHQAAEDLQADYSPVKTFIDMWDEGSLHQDWLLQRLLEIWHERLADAEAVQQVIQPDSIPSW